MIDDGSLVVCGPVAWQDSDAPPKCPTIKDGEPVRLLWRDAQGRRCTTWRSAQQLGELVHPNAMLTTPPPSSPVAELVASIEHYFKNYMLDEADDDHVCNTDSQHNAAVRVRDAIEAMSAPHDEPLFTASMYGTAAAADKAREEWLAAKVEPQARHWRLAVRDFHDHTIEMDGEDWIEQRARSLAQAEQAAKKCQCAACASTPHASDCSVHNEPAYPNGPCDCGAARTFDEVQWPRRRLSMTFTHDTCGDALFCRMCVVAAQEYFAADSGNGVVLALVASNGVRVQITSHELLQWKKAQL